MGDPLAEYRESVLSQAINRDLLDGLGCGWRSLDYLPTVEGLATCPPQLTPRVVARLDREMERRYWRGGLWPRRRAARWGWKDPRTSVLIPVWHAVFPDATFVHIFRDGRSVARSLYERDLETLGRTDVVDDAGRRARFRKDITLWENYERRIRESLPRFGRCVSIRYESLLESPRDPLIRLVDALELGSPLSLKDLERSVDRGRGCRPWPSWTEGLAEDNPLLNELGYSRSGSEP